MANLTRQSLQLPTEVSSEILQNTQEQSAVMQLARQVQLPGTGVSIPVILSDPEAAWVKEGEKKAVSSATVDTKKLVAYKLAVIEPFSMEFKRDIPALYDALVARLPLALANKFDATVFGKVDKPGEDFDTLKAVTGQDIKTDAYKGLVAADLDISEHDGIVNGYVISPRCKSILLTATDTTNRPLFINSVAEGAIPMILGAPTKQSKGAYVEGTPNTVGYVGDWTKAIYGTVEGVQVTISDQATITSESETINLWQQNMFAVRAEIELGFRCDTTVFNRLTVTA